MVFVALSLNLLDTKKTPREGGAFRFGLGGQYWTRTSDLYHVKVAL